MVGLLYLKHAFDESDESLVARWVENPYWQFFCGFDYLQHRLPIEPSSLSRWRDRIGASGMERLLAATIDAALGAGAVKPSSFERVTIDTTVQPKAIAFPTDSRLWALLQNVSGGTWGGCVFDLDAITKALGPVP